MRNTNSAFTGTNNSIRASAAPQFTFINSTITTVSRATQSKLAHNQHHPNEPQIRQRQQHQPSTQGHDVPQVPKEIIEISDDEDEEENDNKNETEVLETSPTASQPPPTPAPKPVKKSIADMTWYKAGCSATNTTANTAIYGLNNHIARKTWTEERQWTEWRVKKEAKEVLRKEAEKAAVKLEATPEPVPEPVPEARVKESSKKPNERTMKRKLDEKIYGQREFEEKAKKQKPTTSGTEDSVWANPLTFEQIEATRSSKSTKSESPVPALVTLASAIPQLVPVAAPAQRRVPMLRSVASPAHALGPATVLPPVVVSARPVKAPVPEEREIEHQPTVVATTDDGTGLDDLFDGESWEDWFNSEEEVERQPTVTKIQKRGLGDYLDDCLPKEDALNELVEQVAVDSAKKSTIDMQAVLENMFAEREDED